jgi:hypothetical protein
MTKDADDNQSSPSEGLRESGIYVFMDEVNHETIKPVIEWILYENYVTQHKKKESFIA